MFHNCASCVALGPLARWPRASDLQTGGGLSVGVPVVGNGRRPEDDYCTFVVYCLSACM